MDISEEFFNEGRKEAFKSLLEILNQYKGKASITEKFFRDVWQEALQRKASIIADGWYSPPPKGMAVLSGEITYPSRVSFDTLRKEQNWPSERVINWDSDILYLYCSPVHMLSGFPGDFAITLYFGRDERVRRHFKVTHQATREILDALSHLQNSSELFDLSQRIFLKHRLQNCIVSYTDKVPLDLGHTLPQIKLSNKYESLNLTDQQKNDIRIARQFINAESSWPFVNGLQFTVEPQLISLDDPQLPQVAYHYLIQQLDGFHVCTDVDSLLAQYDLI